MSYSKRFQEFFNCPTLKLLKELVILRQASKANQTLRRAMSLEINKHNTLNQF